MNNQSSLTRCVPAPDSPDNSTNLQNLVSQRGSRDKSPSLKATFQAFVAKLFRSFTRHRIALIAAGILLGASGYFYGNTLLFCEARQVMVRSPVLTATPSLNKLGFNDGMLSSVRALNSYIGSEEYLGRLKSRELDESTADSISRQLRWEWANEATRIEFTLMGRASRLTSKLVNLCGQEACRWANQYMIEEAQSIQKGIHQRLESLETNLALAYEAFMAMQGELGAVNIESRMSEEWKQLQEFETTIEQTRLRADGMEAQIQSLVNEIARHHPALLNIRRELDQASLKLTERHPRVQELKATMARIESRVALTATNAQVDPDIVLESSALGRGLYSKVLELRAQQGALRREIDSLENLKGQTEEKLRRFPSKQLEYVRLKLRYESLAAAREDLLRGQTEVGELLIAAPRAYELMASVNVSRRRDAWERWKPVGVAAAGGFTGMGVLLLGAVCWDQRFRRVRDEQDVCEATGLPLLGVLGDLERMTSVQRRRWAFDAFNALKARIGEGSLKGLVCGLISSRHKEGRSTWTELLAGAAHESGYKVVVLSAGPTGIVGEEELGQSAGVPRGLPACPEEIPEILEGGGQTPHHELHPSDWVWNLQRRRQWQEAIEKCRAMENAVVLIELPPVEEPESVLLAENLSQVIWLCGKDMTTMDETRTNIERVSHGGAQLVGAVFNQPNAGGFRGNWLRSWSKPLVNGVLLGWLCMMVSEVRGATNEAPTQTNRLAALSVVSPSQMAVWQKRFTLGPGDILDVSIYGQPDTLRKELTIGPDGRMNYLQARDVMVSGLTVEELRGKLEETLGQFYRPPFRIMVLPRAYHSKKYYLLGNVRQRGAFALNQPLTILEAIARAEGFLVNADARHTLMLADVSRSFLIRKEEDGQFKRMNINFEDLFLRGDLSQNVTLAPEDYLFFPALDVQEVYVLGEVVRPGVATYVPGTSLMRALVSAGGFKEKAYRSKVLVVRGSLNQPQPIVINVNDVLEARAPDHKLEPRDIIYVSRRPWAKAEDLLELAVTEFLRAAIITWTGQNVGPIIKDPWFD